jgi:hypothetical protein
MKLNKLVWIIALVMLVLTVFGAWYVYQPYKTDVIVNMFSNDTEVIDPTIRLGELETSNETLETNETELNESDETNETEREPTEPIEDGPEELEPIIYTEPTERVLRFQLPSDNPLNSKSYVVTLTGNEINYDVETETLENGSIRFIIKSPELTDYNVTDTKSGKILTEKEDVYLARRQSLESEKIENKSKYAEIETERKEILMYDKLPVELYSRQESKQIESKTTDTRIVYDFIVNPEIDTSFKFGEHSGTVYLTEDLVSYWKFDGNATDSVNNNSISFTNHGFNAGKINNGTFANSNTASGVHSSYLFNNYGTSDFTINFWFYGKQPPSDSYSMIFGEFKGTDPYQGPTIFYDPLNLTGGGNSIIFRTVGGTSTDTFSITSPSASSLYNNWTMITFLRISGVLKVYYDGEEVGSKSSNQNIGSLNNKFIGGRNIGSQSFKTGMGLDEFAVWTKALNSTEIEALYNNGTGLQYPFRNVNIQTNNATNITNTTVTLNGEVIDNNPVSPLNLSFQYRESGESDWINTSRKSLSGNVSFEENLTGLEAITTYEFRAKAEWDNNAEEVFGDTLNFTTLETVGLQSLGFNRTAPVYTTQSFKGIGNLTEANSDARVNYKIIRTRAGSNSTLVDSSTSSFTNDVEWTTSTVATTSTQQGDLFYLEATVVNVSNTSQIFSYTNTTLALEIVNRNPIINDLYYDTGANAVTQRDIKAYVNVNDLDLDVTNLTWTIQQVVGSGFTTQNGGINNTDKNTDILLYTINSTNTTVDDIFQLNVTLRDNFGGIKTEAVNVTVIDSLADVIRIDFDTSPVYTTDDIVTTAVLDSNNSDDVQVNYIIYKNSAHYSNGTITDYSEDVGNYSFIIPTITSANTSQTDYFNVFAYPQDTEGNIIGDSLNNSFTVVNRNPSVSDLRFSPLPVIDEQNFNIYTTPNDLDSDNLTLFYVVNRTRGAVTTTIAEGNVSDVSGTAGSYAEVELASVLEAEIEVDDQLRFFVTPYDGYNNGTQQQSDLVTVEELTEALIKVTDKYTGNFIINYSIEFEDVNYTSDASGEILLDIEGGDYNISFFNITDGAGYLNQTYLNQAMIPGSTYTFNLSQTIINFEVLTKYGEENIQEFTLITEEGSFSTTNGSITIYPHFDEIYSWNITTPNYYNQTNVEFNINIREGTIQAYNFTNALIRFVDNNTSTGISSAPIELKYPDGSTFNFETDSDGYIEVAGQIDGNDSIFNVTILSYLGYNTPQTFSYNISNVINVSNSIGSRQLIIYVKNENNNTIINNVQGTFTKEDIIESFETTNGTILISNIEPGEYLFFFESTGYNQRSYILTITEEFSQNTTVFLNPETTNVVMKFQDSLTTTSISSVSVSMSRIINNSWTIVESRLTDLSGQVQFSYTPGVSYRFNAYKSDYEEKIFTLNPIIFSSYTVKMDQITTLEDSVPGIGIDISWSPNRFYFNDSGNIQFRVISPQGLLTNYTLNITYNNISTLYNGVNPLGEIISHPYNLTNETEKFITLEYTYHSPTTGNKRYILPYRIEGIKLGRTIEDIKNNVYGLGMFERVSISIIAAMIVAGIISFVAGFIAGGAAGLVVLGAFAYIGLLPLWAIIISLVVGFMLLIKGGSG